MEFWLPGALSPGRNPLGREADHSPPSSVNVKNAWSYTSASQIRLHGAVISKAPGKYLLESTPTDARNTSGR
jgi:hypothetical protein